MNRTVAELAPYELFSLIMLAGLFIIAIPMIFRAYKEIEGSPFGAYVIFWGGVAALYGLPALIGLETLGG